MRSDELLSRAMGLHERGRLAEAEGIYRQILARTPQHADALHLLGVLAGQRDQTDVAIELISRAIGRDGNVASYHCNIAEMYRKTGKLEAAMSHARRAVQLKPGLMEAQVILGVVLSDCGKVDEAIEVYRRVIAVRPDWVAAYVNLGNILKSKGRFAEAIESFRRAIALSPGMAAIHLNLGNTFQEAERLEEAIAEFQQVAELDPNGEQGHRSLGFLLSETGRKQEAIPVFRRALEINPNSAEMFNDLGNALVDTGKIDQGIAVIRRAIEIYPGMAVAHYNLGNALRENEQIDEAVKAFDEAIKLKPDYAHAHFNRGLIFLLRGEYSEGWPGYEWRAKAQPMFIFRPEGFAEPKWNGEELNGRTILLHAEQGFGDTIQAIRFVPMVMERGGRVVLCCQPGLVRLFRGVAGIQKIIVPGDTVPRIDLHCPLMSVPKALGIEVGTIPNTVPYLNPDPELAENWKRRIGDWGAKLKVGLVWKGSVTHSLDRLRSIDAKLLLALGMVPGVRFISLQKAAVAKEPPPRPAETSGGQGKGEKRGEDFKSEISDWTDELNDFADTAALVANLDLVISVDTAVAHLAGAMGKKVWVLISNRPDWRWGLDRDDSPWYPTARLFRQSTGGDWESVIAKVVEALQKV